MIDTKVHIVCYSGGHSSGLVAIEVVRKFGKDSVILINHDINDNVEDADMKRFKREVSEYLGIPITYANIDLIKDSAKIPDQFDVCIKSKSFVNMDGKALCTTRLKTEPFHKWLDSNCTDHPTLFEDTYLKKNVTIYYGFDAFEEDRIMRRWEIMRDYGFKTDYPLASWKVRTIHSTTEININPPNTYSKKKHANCDGCLKGGLQHWYVVFCTRPDIWEKGKITELKIGHSILKTTRNKKKVPLFLNELESIFYLMKYDGVPATENYKGFRKDLKKYKLTASVEEHKPCECHIK